MEPFNQNLTKFTFLSILLDFLWCNAKDNENLECVQGLSFEYIDSLENNSTNHLLIIDYSREVICNLKAFADIATVGRHLGLSTI